MVGLILILLVVHLLSLVTGWRYSVRSSAIFLPILYGQNSSGKGRKSSRNRLPLLSLHEQHFPLPREPRKHYPEVNRDRLNYDVDLSFVVLLFIGCSCYFHQFVFGFIHLIIFLLLVVCYVRFNHHILSCIICFLY